VQLRLFVGLDVGDPHRPLTDAKARSIKPDDKNALADGTVTGLTLQPTGRKGRGHWNLRFVSPVRKKRRDMGLGVYPEVSIVEARRLAADARKMIAGGEDPIDARATLKTAPARITFEQASSRMCDQKKSGWSQRHSQSWITSLEIHAFPIIGNVPVELLRAENFRKVLEPIWLTLPETATRVKQRCKAVMNWCMAQGLIVGNPCTALEHLLPNRKVRAEHQPSMPWKEVPDFVKNILHDGTAGTCREAMEFLILSAARSGEVRKMRWADVDLEKKMWTCPAEVMKGGVAHRVPLSWRMTEILESQKQRDSHPTLVFPSPQRKVLSDNTLSKFLRDHGAISDTPGRRAVVHGFRSSFRDWGAENEYEEHLLEQCLAHTERNAVKAAYKRTDLLEQRRPIMEDWANFVCSRKTVTDANGS
jgi:integrase